MPVPVGPHMGGPSTFDKWKMGLLMGGTVGTIMGFIFGSVNILRNGAGPNGVMRTLSQYMIGSGSAFGFFMSIGAVVRQDTFADAATTHAFTHARRPYPALSSPSGGVTSLFARTSSTPRASEWTARDVVVLPARKEARRRGGDDAEAAAVGDAGNRQADRGTVNANGRAERTR